MRISFVYFVCCINSQFCSLVAFAEIEFGLARVEFATFQGCAGDLLRNRRAEFARRELQPQKEFNPNATLFVGWPQKLLCFSCFCVERVLRFERSSDLRLILFVFVCCVNFRENAPLLADLYSFREFRPLRKDEMPNANSAV